MPRDFAPRDTAPDLFPALTKALRAAGFRGEIESDSALRAAMSTDNSVYQIWPDLIVAPQDGADVACLMAVMAQGPFQGLALTARGGGTGTNGQALNRGVIVDLRRNMNRLLAVNAAEQWAEVEPGMVLDHLNEQLRPQGLFFAPETSTSTRCTIGGMVSTDASGKGSRIYGKTSDNILGLEIARPEGLLSSMAATAPDWAAPLLQQAEAAARQGRAAFIAATPRLNRRFTGYDLERACPDLGGFEWFRLFLGAEGTLGLVTRIRMKLRRIEPEKRLIVVGFDSFQNALRAAAPLVEEDPTALEVMDERVAELAESAGILRRLPPALRPAEGGRVGYLFIEYNGTDARDLAARLERCRARIATLPGAGAIHIAQDAAEIRELWAIRSAGVGLLGKIDGPARPVAFVEDCVVPPENLPGFVEEFLEVLRRNDLGFGIYGHVDVGCLHIRPALNIDCDADRARLVTVSDAVFVLSRKYGGIFWGEHGKGVRGAYLRDWIGPEAYRALQAVKAAFDPEGRFNPGKLVSPRDDIMGIATTPFRRMNAPEGDALQKAFRCNGNAQCLSYAAATPMCPSFKATGDVRHSPKGRADGLRAWAMARQSPGIAPPLDERDLYATLDTCLGCKACASSCPVQVDIPQMRAAFLADYFSRHRRPLADRLTILAEAASPLLLQLAPLWRPFWPLMRRIGGRVMQAVDLPEDIAKPLPRAQRLRARDLHRPLPQNAIILVQDWFTVLFDGELQRDLVAGFTALGFAPFLLEMRPAGKAAQSLGALKPAARMGRRLAALLEQAANRAPLIGADPAFVMMLRQDYPKAGLTVPEVLMPQEFLLRALRAGHSFAPLRAGEVPVLFNHCTETTARPQVAAEWAEVFTTLGLTLHSPATGCCGMAGLFGHQARHQPVSRKLFDMSWRRHAETEAPVLATGFSCRCQTERLSGRAPRHPLGWLADQMRQATGQPES